MCVLKSFRSTARFPLQTFQSLIWNLVPEHGDYSGFTLAPPKEAKGEGRVVMAEADRLGTVYLETYK